VHRGEVPFFRVGDDVLFYRAHVDRWIDGKERDGGGKAKTYKEAMRMAESWADKARERNVDRALIRPFPFRMQPIPDDVLDEIVDTRRRARGRIYSDDLSAWLAHQGSGLPDAPDPEFVLGRSGGMAELRAEFGRGSSSAVASNDSRRDRDTSRRDRDDGEDDRRRSRDRDRDEDRGRDRDRDDDRRRDRDDDRDERRRDRDRDDEPEREPARDEDGELKKAPRPSGMDEDEGEDEDDGIADDYDPYAEDEDDGYQIEDEDEDLGGDAEHESYEAPPPPPKGIEIFDFFVGGTCRAGATQTAVLDLSYDGPGDGEIGTLGIEWDFFVGERIVANDVLEFKRESGSMELEFDLECPVTVGRGRLEVLVRDGARNLQAESETSFEVKESSGRTFAKLNKPSAKRCLTSGAELDDDSDYGMAETQGLSAEQIGSAVRGFQEQTLRCHVGGSHSGQVVMEFTVGCDGIVKNVEVTEDATSDLSGNFAQCVADTMAYAPFPAHARDEVFFTMPLRFE
jgi:hypothetical protein